ncbi:HAD hydrolase-like protein [Arthrobacter sp. I2-34]|uniref:HAD hydrolase-like protein n=1 Tax=Arthrobacter hankyongi TaxID=2904801 RepID=A0ABS9L6D2_9MICC|nr:HAD hydrolase-like protein [Arthrobacter hankyongi]MCG2622049.1 HAD hydrolase-like protein [Arthrobacter hankyongi]
MTSFPALVLFDLDGTLVDPAGSITGGISRALSAAGLPVPPPPVLGSMVGPPLGHSLRALAGVPDERVAEVIGLYRAEYRERGMAESRIYPGIEELLQRLRGRGFRLSVATQKPEPIAAELLRVQGLAGYFDDLHGAGFDDPQDPAAAGLGKVPIVGAALAAGAAAAGTAALQVPAVMVGDRHFDVAAAVQHGIPALGAAWGFAAAGELEAAGAAAVVHSAEDLEEHLMQLVAGIPAGAGR